MTRHEEYTCRGCGAVSKQRSRAARTLAPCPDCGSVTTWERNSDAYEHRTTADP